MANVLAIGMPGGSEWIVIALIGLLLFGKKLPEVGKSLGKGIVEFKKGLKGVEDEVRQVDVTGTSSYSSQAALPSGYAGGQSQYKFDPHTGEPVQPAVVPPGAKFDPYTGKPLETAADDAGHSIAGSHADYHVDAHDSSHGPIHDHLNEPQTADHA